MGFDAYLRKAVVWHKRANDEEDPCVANDPFITFSLEFIAFDSLLKWLNENFEHYDTRGTGGNQRKLIQKLKQDKNVEGRFLKTLKNAEKVKIEEIKANLEKINKNPVKDLGGPSTLYWDCDKNNWKDCRNRDRIRDGTLRGIKDYINVVELIYRIRNNLFHGGKAPDIERDEFLVETACLFLTPLIDAILELYTSESRIAEDLKV